MDHLFEVPLVCGGISKPKNHMIGAMFPHSCKINCVKTRTSYDSSTIRQVFYEQPDRNLLCGGCRHIPSTKKKKCDGCCGRIKKIDLKYGIGMFKSMFDQRVLEVLYRVGKHDCLFDKTSAMCVNGKVSQLIDGTYDDALMFDVIWNERSTIDINTITSMVNQIKIGGTLVSKITSQTEKKWLTIFSTLTHYFTDCTWVVPSTNTFPKPLMYAVFSNLKRFGESGNLTSDLLDGNSSKVCVQQSYNLAYDFRMKIIYLNFSHIEWCKMYTESNTTSLHIDFDDWNKIDDPVMTEINDMVVNMIRNNNLKREWFTLEFIDFNSLIIFPYSYDYSQPYNPTSSPSYDPNSPSYGPNSPSYGPNSPSYGPNSPSYGPNSPSYGPNSPSYGPISPSYGPNSPSYGPNSPSYDPNSPSYDPNSPSYDPSRQSNKAENAVDWLNSNIKM